MADPKITWSADEKDVVRALDKMHAKMNALIEDNRKLRSESKKATDVAKGGFDASVLSLGKMAAGYISLQAGASLVTQELEDQLRIQKEIAALQKSTAQPQGSFLRSLGFVSQAERKARVDQVKAISRDTGVSQETLYGAGVSALNAKGQLSNKQALEALAVAARIAPDNPQELTATAGGLLDLVSLTKSANPMHNAGFMAALGEQTRVGSLEHINKNLVPAAISASGYGGTDAESAALVATLTSVMKDTTGAQSGTSSIRLAEQLAEFLPDTDTFSTDARGRKKRLRRGTGLKETDDRIRFLQANPELRDQFMQQATFEAQAKIPSRDLLTKGTEAAQLFEQNIKGYGGNLSGKAEAFIEGIGAVPLQRQSDLERRGTNAVEMNNLEDRESGLRATARGTFSKWMESRGTFAPDRWARNAMMSATGFFDGDVDYAIGQVEQSAFNKFGTHGERTFNPKVAAENAETLKVLMAIRDELKSIRKTPARQVNIDAHTE